MNKADTNYVGFALYNPAGFSYSNTNGHMCTFMWGTPLSTAAMSGININAGAIDYKRTVSSTFTSTQAYTAPVASWMYVEVEFKAATTGGFVNVYVDGVQRFAYSGATTDIGGSTLTPMFGGHGTGGFYCTVDDMYICDNLGTANNSRRGNVQVNAVRPDADGNYQQFVPSTGTDHFATVDENPFSGTDWNLGSAGNKDSYGMTAFDTSRGVHGIQVSNKVGTETGTDSLGRNFLRISGVDYSLPTQTIGSSSPIRADIVEQSPASSVAFTGTELNNAEFGYEVMS
jgi:hypothetical protein